MITSVHPLQALAVGIALFNLLTFSVAVAPLLPDWLGWVLAFGLFEAAFVTAALRLMTSKPRAVPKEVESPAEGEERMELYCELCQMYVHSGTKHCGKCHCCVDGFDHHCKWLNTCIGGRNYRLFIGLLVALLLVTVILISSEAVVLQQDLELPIFLVILADSICNFVILGMISGLLLFHAYLKVKGISTYDFVTRRRRHSRVQAEPKAEPKAEPLPQIFTETK